MKEDVRTMFGTLIAIGGFLAGNALQNLSVGKSAYQTTTFHSSYPAKAVDGNTNTNHNPSQLCAHTTSTPDEWWEVDLGRIYRIDHVKVFGRTDGSVSRFRQVELYIGYGSQDDYVLRGFYDGIIPVPYTFQLTSPVNGRWVRITRSSTVIDYLTVCEVEVMGEEFSRDSFVFGDGKIGTGGLLQSSQARTKTECCAQCKRVDKCSAVNYNTVTNVCVQLETVSTIEDSSEDMYFYRLP